MEFIGGTKVTALSPLKRLDLDGEKLADQLFEAYLKQILVDGFVHADPHPGNVFVTEDGRLALLDLGMIIRFSPPMRDILIELMLAISEGRGDEAGGRGRTDVGRNEHIFQLLVVARRERRAEGAKSGRQHAARAAGDAIPNARARRPEQWWRRERWACGCPRA